jgi:hypothetical protein
VNYLQIVQRLHRESGRSTAAPTTVVGANERHARLFDWAADSWRDLQGERDWRWMRASLDVALTIDQKVYTGAGLGATRFGRWRQQDREYSPGIYIDGSINTLQELEFLQLDEFNRQWVYRNDYASQPLNWTVDNDNQLLIGPKPALAYKLRVDYWKSASELAADADTPDMPERFHMLLVWRALQEVAKFDAAPEVLARAEKNYSDLKGRMLFDQARLPRMP